MPELLPERFGDSKVTERLHPTHDLACLIPQHRSGDADGNTFAIVAYDVGGLVNVGLASLQRLAQAAVVLTYVRLENLEAITPEGVLRLDSGDLFGCSVEICDLPVLIDGEHPISNGVQDGVAPAWAGVRAWLAVVHAVPLTSQPFLSLR